MQYNPKLKKVMEAIKKLLIDNDVAGSVILHQPGHGEFFFHIATSYSCAKIDNEKGAIRLRAKLNEDFKGDKKKHKQVLTDTINMISVMHDISGQLFMTFDELIQLAKKNMDIEEQRGDTSSHIQQNN